MESDAVAKYVSGSRQLSAFTDCQKKEAIKKKCRLIYRLGIKDSKAISQCVCLWWTMLPSADTDRRFSLLRQNKGFCGSETMDERTRRRSGRCSLQWQRELSYFYKRRIPLCGIGLFPMYIPIRKCHGGRCLECAFSQCKRTMGFL